MNKIIIRGILFSVVSGLLLLILLKSRYPFGRNNSSFSIDTKKEITKIEFSDESRKLSLVKVGDNWLINGKKETRKGAILFILKVLREIKIKSPVSSELFEDEITRKGIQPVKVKVYEKSRLIRSFLVYKTSANTYGNIMKIKDGSKPFIVSVPGSENDIGSGFSVNELFWQPYIVFNLLPSEIASVVFENLSDTSFSFSIINKKNSFNISDRIQNLSGWDSALVKRYLTYFTWIPFESWALGIGEDGKKTIESQQPLYRITVKTNKGSTTILTLWRKMTDENNVKTIDSDRLFGKMQNVDEFFIMRYFDIDPLIKKRSYFFPN